MRYVANSERVRSWKLFGLSLLASVAVLAGKPAIAADCPGNPTALGTSRTLVVDPKEYSRIGSMQYPDSLPLADHEVVLTFDDGPIPKYSNQIIDTLAAECVKATFFIIGRMARTYPEGVRKLIAAGHTVGTHTENHPLSMNRMALDRAKQEIDDGIASVRAALKDPDTLAPFFRIPGLLRAGVVEDYLSSQGIQTWSADFPADDWRHISAEQVRQLAVSRIVARGRGVLLLHDIQKRTVGALPLILSDLKARGFRIVHVVAARPGLPATPSTPQQWRGRHSEPAIASMRWPRIPKFVYADLAKFPGPSLTMSQHIFPSDSARGQFGLLVKGDLPLRGTSTQMHDALTASAASPMLPVPALNLFEIAERNNVPVRAMLPMPKHAAEPAHQLSGINRLLKIDAAENHRAPTTGAPVAPRGLKYTPIIIR
jgi:peptidoglycan/xylan/chitin deacetylase (PgdA/CDA1 family)